ncbi:hypothetical protein O185_13545 [Photorhabdus temperata J3]|uniref:Uncharacterized protein n=1 Tax=Photorhabdus temperata J3 TaxID=1389415 RepID=U7QX49_PHOTE|nr:hypothetical protein O185_13545 [Photorhabdus temperata J3]
MIVYITSAASTIKKGKGKGLQPESGVFRKWFSLPKNSRLILA